MGQRPHPQSTGAVRCQELAGGSSGACKLNIELIGHVAEQACVGAALCDHIIVIADGEVRAEGTADELRQLSGIDNLEDAFVSLVGTDEGLMA